MCYLEVAAWVVGAGCAAGVLLNKKAQTEGIGPYTIRALTVSLGVPLILTLAVEKILDAPVAAILSGSLALGVQKDKP